MKKIHSFYRGLLILLILVGGLFGFVQGSQAQSVQTWSEPINLSRSGVGSNPAMIVDSKGGLHVIWVDKFEGYKYVESPDGVTWSSPVTVIFPFSSKQAVPPVFLAGANGVVHIFWLDDKNGLSYAQAVSETLGTPSAWRAKTNLDSSVLDFDVALDAQGRLHIGYVKNPAPAGDKAGVFYRRSVNGGSTWSSSSLLFDSPYFRSLSSENAHVRIAVSDKDQVYAVWDDQPEKRIFISSSQDGGQNWNPSTELITPQASLGFKTPYHADIDLLQDKLLVTWQVGDPGARCTPYSWTSSDGGKTWSEPIRILGELAGCPERSEFIPIDKSYSTLLFSIQGDLFVSAWNGSEWSNLEAQSGPSSITNPATFEPVNLGCEQVQAYSNQLFVIGCDQGSESDIWFLARKLDPLGNLYPQPSVWGGDVNVTTVSQAITSLSSVSDVANNVHALWIQSSSSPADPSNPQIEYSRWNGTEWTNPVSVITNLPGTPLSLAVKIDNRQRLLLSWINQQTGELLFSWANSERANLPSEWAAPTVVSAPSQVTNSPDILVDSSGKIVIAYAVTLNEGRGIYVIQSTDLGVTWSSPVQVFDAVSANWQMVDQPQLAASEDGKLHILFTQYTIPGKQEAVGLYYSQSEDGGTNWTTPQLVNENPVQWSQIIASKEAIHRFWQEKNKSEVVTVYQQQSTDGGNTWNLPAIVPTEASVISKPTVSVDWAGKLYFLEVLQEDICTLQEWVGTDGQWQLSETRKLGLPKQESQMTLADGLTSNGKLYAILQFEKPKDDGVETSLLSISRSLEGAEAAQPSEVFISTPQALLPTATPDLQVASTPVSPLANLQETQSPLIKNLVGVLLILSVVLVTVILTLPRRKKQKDTPK